MTLAPEKEVEAATVVTEQPPVQGAPKAPRPPRGPRPPKPPKPPRRPPSAAIVYAPLTPVQVFARSSFALVAILVLGFVADIALLSGVQHASSQQQLLNTYREQLAEGTAPVSEGDVDDHLLADGVPVGIIRIPAIGVDEVIVEGTSAGDLMAGPGHRRDTVLPGQEGTSVLFGRAAAYGGPFGRIESLQPGDAFSVLTGQGLMEFEVIGVRYAGDPAPPDPEAGESRLVLVTARGPAFAPSGVAYLDAQLVGDAKPQGARQTTGASLLPSHRALATDLTTVWALIFALQFLLLVEAAAVWVIPRIGGRKAWIVFAPLALLGGLWVSTQLVLLLPNLL
ncbi:sortase [Homoserinibacter sp. GY 40078]|uniref:sortase n=1 Tax=Homoserinibacter sp. GY 40078 TaxID=2603275 RepID=UPI0011CC463E|nr:class E sortase [Homoserinibacter sp. GY 40078]TXK19485.1 class E sortase [Homoserinibacter sp. GY 40078]